MRDILSSVRQRLRRVARATRTSGDAGHGGEDGTEANGDDPALDDGAVVTDGGTTAGSDGFVDRLNDRFGDDFTESAPFWLPPFLLVGLFVYGAIAWNFVISLTDYQGFIGPDYSDLDFEMYVRAINDSAVIDATVNTFLLVVAFTAVALGFGLLLAILIDRNIRFENTFRTIYLLPMSLSFVVTAQFWLWMYNYNNGVVNIVLGTVGIGPISWIGNSSIVLWAVVFALVWQFSGYTMVVYLAGLRAIPTEHYEAARVDGASTLKMYWRVILPQLKGSTISAAIVLMVFALKAFDFLYSLVSGYRPPNGADILATKMVREAYSTNNWAYASAIAIILFLMALSIIGPYLYYEYKQGNL
ncbi:ABC transporter permease subunit [Halobaculum sp. WSA2]|uniref:ABC transporter permease subunit n=1 Tax=Halobaculum saliterrae TaxID=2073113 RepID=A0A6B0SPL8_9EURY|nr:sugar ABC transporter permease [Halobaculum saliterrae]MXR40868.1 ABC transporter permease subunit [Halobaculum saliterrae]